MSKKHKKDEEQDGNLIKHMEMIQSVVARLANEAALIRGWALTVSSAFFAFAAQSYSWRVAAVGLLPVIAFWGLNAYYLRAERQYRCLYNRVRKGELIEPFLMDASREDVATWWKTCRSLTLWPFYGVIVLVGVLLIAAGLYNLGDSSATQGRTYFLN